MSIILVLAILTIFLLGNQVVASESTHECSHECLHDICRLSTFSDYTWEKEIVVEVNNEAETFTYPKNPNYRYIFVWFTPSQTRAVCYNCGVSAMGTVTRKVQWGLDYLECPLAWGAGMSNDFFSTYHHYTRERCTACGYQSQEWLDRLSYTAWCSNEDNPIIGEWEVREEYTPAAGYNPHQSLRWWLYKETIL